MWIHKHIYYDSSKLYQLSKSFKLLELLALNTGNFMAAVKRKAYNSINKCNSAVSWLIISLNTCTQALMNNESK